MHQTILPLIINHANLSNKLICRYKYQNMHRHIFYASIPMDEIRNMNALAIPMLSQKKLNTYGVESPCGCLSRVGSFLANPGLSKEQLVPSCEMRTFILRNSFIGILAQHLRRCTMRAFILRISSIGILA